MSNASWWLQNAEALVGIARASLVAGRQSLKALKVAMPWTHKRLTGPAGRALVAGRRSLELRNASSALRTDFKQAASAKNYLAAKHAAADASRRLKERAQARRTAAAKASLAKSAWASAKGAATAPSQPASISPRTPPSGGRKR